MKNKLEVLEKMLARTGWKKIETIAFEEEYHNEIYKLGADEIVLYCKGGYVLKGERFDYNCEDAPLF